MTCCNNPGSCTHVSALSVEQVQALCVSAQSFGFSAEDVDAVRAQHGDEVLSLMTEAARSGFSIGFVMDILKRFGPAVLQFLYELWNEQVMAAGVAAQSSGEAIVLEGPLVQGVQEGIVNMLLNKLLEQLPNLLPVLLEKYGDQVLKLIVDTLLKVLAKQSAAPPVAENPLA